ncbi:hypothetical protein ACUODJ_47725, partial [Escherichia sp. HC-CC]
ALTSIPNASVSMGVRLHISRAGHNIEGPCYDKRREVIEMLNGSVPNDELFGIIYTVDEGDDWTDPQVLEKANPNIGVSVYREFLLSQQQRVGPVVTFINGIDDPEQFIVGY